MLFNIDKNWAFLHYPKTGGMSFKNWLVSVFPAGVSRKGPAHATLTECIEDDMPIDLANSHLLMVIREPVAMLRSFWRYMPDLRAERKLMPLSTMSAKLGYPEELLATTHETPFSEFLKAFDRTFPSYREYVTLPDGSFPVGLKLIRLEEIEEGAVATMRSVAFREPSVGMPRVNAAEAKEVKEPFTLSSEDLDLICRKFSWCYEGAYPRPTYEVTS